MEVFVANLFFLVTWPVSLRECQIYAGRGVELLGPRCCRRRGDERDDGCSNETHGNRNSDGASVLFRAAPIR